MTDANAPEKIVINGVEYDPSDAQTLIDLGSKTRDFEKQFNTNLDGVGKQMSDYTRATQEAARAKDLERELEEAKRKADEYDRIRQSVAIPDENKKALQAARELGLADQEYLTQKGYVTRDELNKIIEERQTQQALVNNVLTQADQLAKEIDGSDGRIPFNKKAVLAYASAYNIADLGQAYDEMNETANKAWKDKQLADAKKPGLTTLQPRGAKVPEEKKIDDSNFSQALREELWGAGE